MSLLNSTASASFSGGNSIPIPKRKWSYEELECKYDELKEAHALKKEFHAKLIKRYKQQLVNIAGYERMLKEANQKKNEEASLKRKKTIEKTSKFESLFLQKEQENMLLKSNLEELEKKFKPPQNRKPNPWWALHVNPVPFPIESADMVHCIDCNKLFSTKRPGGEPRLGYAKIQFASHACSKWPDCIARMKECSVIPKYVKRKKTLTGSFVIENKSD